MVLRVIFPFALKCNPQGVTDQSNAFRSETNFFSKKFRRKCEFFLNLAIRIDVVDRMRNQPIGASLGSEVEAAFTI